MLAVTSRVPAAERSLRRPEGLHTRWPCPPLPLRGPLRLHVVLQTNGAAHPTPLPVVLLSAFLFVYALVLPERGLPKTGTHGLCAPQ